MTWNPQNIRIQSKAKHNMGPNGVGPNGLRSLETVKRQSVAIFAVAFTKARDRLGSSGKPKSIYPCSVFKVHENARLPYRGRPRSGGLHRQSLGLDRTSPRHRLEELAAAQADDFDAMIIDRTPLGIDGLSIVAALCAGGGLWRHCDFCLNPLFAQPSF